MNYKTLRYLLASLTCLILYPANSAEILVTSTADSGPGTLRNAVSLAAPGDLISIGVSGTIQLASPIVFFNSVEVRGAQPIHSKIDLALLPTSTPAFEASGGTIVIKGLSFINSNSSADKLAINIDAGVTVKVFNSVFENCTMSAIYCSGQLEAHSVSFISNSTLNEGGAVALYSSSGTLNKFTNCVFYQNSSSQHGGAIRKNGGDMEVINCTFFQNSAGGSGTEISNFGAGLVYIQNNIFHQTTAPANAFSNTSAPNWGNGGGNVFTFNPTAFQGTGTNDLSGQSSGAINLGPLITDGFGMKYMLINSGSVCIDNGTFAPLLSDIRRAPRAISYTNITTTIQDAGAVEATPYHVTNGASSAIAGSLPLAISDISSTSRPGPYYIDFDISAVPVTISPSVSLEPFNPVIIDGYTQQGTAVYGPGSTPGSLTPPVLGMIIDATASGSGFIFGASTAGASNKLSGFWIKNASNEGVFIGSTSQLLITGNFIESTTTGIKIDNSSQVIVGDSGFFQMNCIANNFTGINISTSNNIQISNNLIGPGLAGNSILGSQTFGIEITSSNLISIGGSSMMRMGNTISGNSGSQISMLGSFDVNVFGNKIGASYDGLNYFFTTSEGVYMDAATVGCFIGGPNPDLGNIIAGQDNAGIMIEGTENHVGNNKIGFSDIGGSITVMSNKVGIYLYGSGCYNNYIGDPGRNYICGNTADGISSENFANSNVITGNFIGISPLNSDVANDGSGIYINSSSGTNHIGSYSIFPGNLISGNTGNGIEFLSAGSGNIVINNTIGLDSTNISAFGNQMDGIHAVNTPQLDIAGNFISGNGDEGIELASDDALVRSNVIGSNSTYNTPVPNGSFGIYISGSLNKIGSSAAFGNYIAFNTLAGVGIGTTSLVNTNGVVGNNIYGNGGLGIDLLGNSGVTTNDVGDSDSGPNTLINFPYNMAASECAGGTRIAGTFDAVAGNSYQIDFYQIPAGMGDPSGFGEGDIYLGSIVESGLVTGPQTFSYYHAAPIPAGDLISATVSRDYGSGNFETSEFSATVTANPAMTISITGTNVTCFGANDGTVSASVTGGTPPYTYQWLDSGGSSIAGATSSSMTGLAPGSYYANIADQSGCTIGTTMYTVTDPAAISGTYTFTNILCNSSCDGSLTITAAGGTPPYLYSIDNGGTFVSGNIFTGLCAGTYSMIIQDANGCTYAVGTHTLTNPAILDLVVSSVDETCNGYCDGSVTLTSTGGTAVLGPIQYSFDGGAYSTSTNYPGLCPSSVTITAIDDNGCTDTEFVTIQPGQVVTAGFTPNTACLGTPVTLTDTSSTNTGSITSWNWSITGGSPATSTQQNPTVTFSSAGSQSVALIAGNGTCTDTLSIVFSVTTPPVVNAGIDTTICFNSTFAQAATVSGGQLPYTISWTPPSNFIDNTIEDAQLTAGLPDGVYNHTLNVTDANGCQSSDIVQVTISPSPVANAGADQSVCPGDTVTLDASGSTNAVVLNWYNSLGTLIASGATQTAIVTTSTYFVAEATDGGFCTSTDTVNISVILPDDPSFSYSPNPVCENLASAIATATTSGGTFAQVSGSPLNLNSSTGEIAVASAVPPATPGSYQITYTTAGTCPATDTVTLIIEPAPDPAVDYPDSIFCNTGTTIPSNIVTPGGLFTAGTGLTLNSTTGEIDLLSSVPGSYTVSYTVISGSCTSVSTSPITINISGDPDIVYNGNIADTILLCTTSPNQLPTSVATAGGNFSSTNGLPINATTGEINPSSVGMGPYQVIYTLPGCGAADTVFISVLGTPGILSSPQTTYTVCDGTSPGVLSVNNPGSGYFVTWYSDPGLTTLVSTGLSFTPPTVSGTTTYYAANNFGPCQGPPLTFTINVSNSSPDAGGPYSICQGAAIQLELTGGTPDSLIWYPGTYLSDSTIMNPIASPPSDILYYVSGEIGGCFFTDSVQVYVSSDGECAFEVFNTFSPDGDGVNDTWTIPGAFTYSENKVYIYNRWGDLLEEFTNYDNINVVWDGTSGGNPLPTGTYYYVIHYPEQNRQYAGWVQLMR